MRAFKTSSAAISNDHLAELPILLKSIHVCTIRTRAILTWVNCFLASTACAFLLALVAGTPQSWRLSNMEQFRVASIV